MTDSLATTNADKAKDRAQRIRDGAQAVNDRSKDVRAAFHERDWEILGYKSWNDYLDAEFAQHRVKLSPHDRQEIVGYMREDGMSTRAIASAVGASVGTVHKDLEVFRNEHEANPPLVIGGLDGKQYEYDAEAAARRAEASRKRQAIREANYAAQQEAERIERDARRAARISRLRAEGFAADFAKLAEALHLLRRVLTYAETVAALPVQEVLSDDELLNLHEALSAAISEAESCAELAADDDDEYSLKGSLDVLRCELTGTCEGLDCHDHHYDLSC